MSYFRAGLVSITFRKLSVEELIGLAVRGGVQGVEWGGDVHVPHGDSAAARRVCALSADAGLTVAAYGSYYRAGESGENNPDFLSVLDSAEALGAPAIRVWAGNRGSADADEGFRQRVTDDLQRICALAAERQIRVALEFHGNTLTDTAESACGLLNALPLGNLDSLWQPPNGKTLDECLAGMEPLLSRISNVHVFHWGPGGWKDRKPLAEGQACWSAYFSRLAWPGTPARWALLEFVKDDDPEQFLRDAATLNRWLADLNGG